MAGTVNATIGNRLLFEALVLDGLGIGRDTKVEGHAFAHGRIIPCRSGKQFI